MLLRQRQYSALCNSRSSNSSSKCQYVSSRALAGNTPALLSAVQHPHHIFGCSTAVISTAGCASTSSIQHVRSAGVICRDAPRPMWARKSPPLEAPKQTGTGLERLITTQIKAAGTVVELENVFNEWGSSFNYIHASAALVKCSKVRGGPRSQLASKLSSAWLLQLPADAQGCANVLWASTRLGGARGLPQVRDATWASLMEHVQRGLDLSSQLISNSLWACAKLAKQPTPDELQLLVQAFLQPDVLAAAQSQHLSNLLWALSRLYQFPGWQGGVTEQDVQQLLGEQQLPVLGAGEDQAVTNVFIALAGLAAGDAPVVGKAFAQQCTMRLLAQTSKRLSDATPQHITVTMWATAELGLPFTVFAQHAMGKGVVWVPQSDSINLTQAASACALLQHKDDVFMTLLLQRASQLLKQQAGNGKAGRSRSRAMSAAERASLAAMLPASVVQLDMQQLAGPTRDLITSSGVGQQPHIHPSNLRRLWVFHSWLLQHQLLDGKGLKGIVTEQQLHKGQQEAAVYGTGFEGLKQD